MLRRIWNWVTGPFGRDSGDEDARFVRSRLDDSVYTSHGGSGAEIEREMENIDRKVEVLDDSQRK